MKSNGEYQPIPAQFISVEAGHSHGPPLMVTSKPQTLAESLDIDKTRNCIVVFLQDFEHVAEREFGLPVKSVIPYALNVGDARQLVIELLANLASCGDIVAQGLCMRLPETMDDLGLHNDT